MSAAHARVPFTLKGALHGARLAIPLLPGVMVFATAFGAAASQKGLDVWQTMAISIFVFAGAAQMVALEVWRETWSLASVLGIMAITATINARMILMGAAVQPWMAGAPPVRNALNLFLFTDANWLIGMRYHQEGGKDLGVMLGAGLALWCAWTLATLPGYLAGALVANPRAFGLDLVMPVFFCAMLVPLWRGFMPAVPWMVAGAVALAVQALGGGYAFIVVGALAGALSAALLPEKN
jgi:predicted branched-subunit amino acid permease